jgi:hypothetical protein
MHFHCHDHGPSHRAIIMNWCERRVMERKASTYLSNDDVFQTLICPLVTCLNEGASISHAAVSEKQNGFTTTSNVAFKKQAGARTSVGWSGAEFV